MRGYVRKGAIFLFALTWLGSASSQPSQQASFQVERTASVKNVQRIGLNLGQWTSWGAEQLCGNVLMNPGFEGIIDRAIVVVRRSGPFGFSDDNAWLGRPDGFWAGAVFDVRTGPMAGTRGTLADSRKAGPDGLPWFTTLKAAPTLGAGDVIALTLTSDRGLPTHWWIPEDSRGLVTVTSKEVRPGSPGRRSLVLRPNFGRSADVVSYLDAIGSRAGKLLPVDGSWMVSFWSRLTEGKGKIRVTFGREGAAPFLAETVRPTPSWLHTTFTFEGTDVGPPGMLALKFTTSGGAKILLDDVSLGPSGSDAFPFRREVVEALETVRPGYLRDWHGQLGDTLTNRLSVPFGRRASRTRPGGREEATYGYSLPEFLTLCERVGANPWVVIPTTFSDEELRDLGRFLKEHLSDRFTEVLVEFGNENWNPLFRPAGVNDPRTHGLAAERAFRMIREGAGPTVPLKTVVNGQHANPESALAFAKHSPSADVLAVAPYFQHVLKAGMSDTERLSGIFSDDGGRLQKLAAGTRQLGKDLAVYEVNLHTTGGNACAADREELAAGIASGSALAKRLLEAVAVGSRRQCVYALSGFDTRLGEVAGFVNLWGIVRDLGRTGRFRPSGLALTLLNRVMAGDLHLTRKSGAGFDEVDVFAFRTPTGWRAAAVSSSPLSRRVSVTFPDCGCPLPRRLVRLDAAGPEATNEKSELVRTVTEAVAVEGFTISFVLPPWGFGVVLSQEESE